MRRASTRTCRTRSATRSSRTASRSTASRCAAPERATHSARWLQAEGDDSITRVLLKYPWCSTGKVAHHRTGVELAAGLQTLCLTSIEACLR